MERTHAVQSNGPTQQEFGKGASTSSSNSEVSLFSAAPASHHPVESLQEFSQKFDVLSLQQKFAILKEIENNYYPLRSSVASKSLYENIKKLDKNDSQQKKEKIWKQVLVYYHNSVFKNKRFWKAIDTAFQKCTQDEVVSVNFKKTVFSKKGPSHGEALLFSFLTVFGIFTLGLIPALYFGFHFGLQLPRYSRDKLTRHTISTLNIFNAAKKLDEISKNSEKAATFLRNFSEKIGSEYFNSNSSQELSGYIYDDNNVLQDKIKKIITYLQDKRSDTDFFSHKNNGKKLFLILVDVINDTPN